MRIDDYLSTVGLVKRRSVAKELGDNGLIEVNGRRVKSSHEVKANDIIIIKGSHSCRAEVLAIPSGSVSKTSRGEYFRVLQSP